MVCVFSLVLASACGCVIFKRIKSFGSVPIGRLKRFWLPLGCQSFDCGVILHSAFVALPLTPDACVQLKKR